MHADAGEEGSHPMIFLKRACLKNLARFYKTTIVDRQVKTGIFYFIYTFSIFLPKRSSITVHIVSIK